MTLEKFHHQIPEGGEIVITRFKFVPAGVIRKTRKESGADQIFSAMEAVADDETIAKVDALTAEELNNFIAAWQKDSGASLGESAAS